MDDYYDDYENDDSDLRNQCACCGHDFRGGAHNDAACAASQE